jgi:hypothetical protein
MYAAQVAPTGRVVCALLCAVNVRADSICDDSCVVTAALPVQRWVKVHACHDTARVCYL